MRLKTLPQMQYPGGWGSCNRSVSVHTASPFPSIFQWDSVLDGTVRERMQFIILMLLQLLKHDFLL